MMLKSLIVEQLEKDGTIRSLRMQPSTDREIVVAFADEYDETRDGPFHFLCEQDERHFRDGFAHCRARRLQSKNFIIEGDVYHFKTCWHGIPTEKYWLSYYALSLPEYAIPKSVSIVDPHSPGREYRRQVIRDDARNRFVIYLECSSSLGRFDFDLSCDFVIEHRIFSGSEYHDSKSAGGAISNDEWERWVREAEKDKIKAFFDARTSTHEEIPPKKIDTIESSVRILFLAANPEATSRLDLEEEIRSIESELRRVQFRESIVLKIGTAVRPDDLVRLMREENPTIVHFSGHGSLQGIILRTESGFLAASGETLKRLFKERNVKLVVLNSCFSEEQAKLLQDVVPAVIGTTAAVEDEAALRFSVAFYRTLGDGHRIRDAFKDGGDAVAMYNLKDVFCSFGDLEVCLCR